MDWTQIALESLPLLSGILEIVITALIMLVVGRLGWGWRQAAVTRAVHTAVSYAEELAARWLGESGEPMSGEQKFGVALSAAKRALPWVSRSRLDQEVHAALAERDGYGATGPKGMR